MKTGKVKITLIFLVAAGLLASCDNDNFTPKPRGYFRIDLPAKQYNLLDSTLPYTFEYPTYANLSPDLHSPNEKYWLNINFTPFKATLHLSYKKVDGDLLTFLEDAHMLVTKHIPKADAIYDSLIVDRQRNVFGLAYEIEGSGAASPYQFFLTDSTSHFLRGALYFNIAPNNDSLQPVIDFIQKDIEHLIGTLRWKDLPPGNATP
ncbi:MAG: gliding motility lipoprotein GldD [Bacteroidales bacterium]|nr:gliding motility lipoprotein GldD [Bacteroidales bacterium]MCF6342448.1 gliding motility lipoprotein GldD [Bacteroidales bacterium]